MKVQFWALLLSGVALVSVASAGSWHRWGHGGYHGHYGGVYSHSGGYYAGDCGGYGATCAGYGYGGACAGYGRDCAGWYGGDCGLSRGHRSGCCSGCGGCRDGGDFDDDCDD